jgi:hypothetical protein
MYYHVIEFVEDSKVDLERAGGQHPEQVLLQRGAWHRARIRPRVIQSDKWLVEVADLTFEDGTVARGVPFAAFAFAE